MDATLDGSLIILLLDPDGQRSPIFAAAVGAGHRPVVVTGIDTAEVILGSMAPDVIILRSVAPALDRQLLARLAACAPSVPIRVLGADGVLTDALEDATVPLN